ncbi:Asp23/Gls24 family envelope stress response protein [Caldalkalibacillus mannanilyticus]|uniref:Asp23/Gls24 family envelope stress response protein n=1 Tax=Caldalkalibacillus mannanilyticus TaxID=1418 RepID=UPI0004696E6D|nr:Asp23/Gls24 family envelope stress response protein [Caldalkalibacillus mannanilyticus]
MNEWKENGIIRIADDVVAVIASIATVETEGIACMSSGIAEGLAKRVSGKQIQKGVHVQIDQHKAAIDIRIIVKFGTKIDHVCRAVQQNVKEAVENMTGLDVSTVNIRVEGVELNKGKALEPSLSM